MVYASPSTIASNNFSHTLPQGNDARGASTTQIVSQAMEWSLALAPMPGVESPVYTHPIMYDDYGSMVDQGIPTAREGT